MRAGRRGASAHTSTRPIRDHGINPHRANDILEALLAQIGKLDRDLAKNLIVRRRRDADTTRFGDAFKTGCYIDAVAKNVMGFDDYVADINAYTKGEALTGDVDGLEAAVDQAIGACGGDLRSTIRALIVANDYLETEVGELMKAVSHAYVRGRFHTYSG